MNIFNQITSEILKYYTPVKIFIYGSYASGKQTDKSDVDVCIQMAPGSIVKRYDFILNKILSAVVHKEVHCVFCTQDNGWCVKQVYPLNETPS